jgi:hypothetical protein
MELHPDFPVKEGKCRLTRDCDLELPEKFNWRIEDGNMVFWRPGLTFWIAVWGRENNRSTEETLEWILDDASPDRTDELVERSGDLIRLTYRLIEEGPDRKPDKFVSISGCDQPPRACPDKRILRRCKIVEGGRGSDPIRTVVARAGMICAARRTIQPPLARHASESRDYRSSIGRQPFFQ